MKTSALFLSLAIATSGSTLVLAAECTMDDLTTISTVYSSAMTDACPDLTTTTDTSDYCSYADCLKFMSDMIDELPDCSTGGVNVKAGIQAAVDFCESGTADTSDVFTDSSSSSTPSTTDSSSSSAATSTDSTTASSGSLLRTASSPSSGTTDSTTTGKVTADTVPPATGGSSSASSIGLAISSAVFAFVVAVGQ